MLPGDSLSAKPSRYRSWLIVPLLLFLCLFAQAANVSPREMLAAGRVDDAIDTLQQQLDRSPTDAAANAAANNLLCRAYFMLEDWDSGIPACVRARELDPTSSQYELWLGRIYGEKASHVGFPFAIGLAKKVRSAFERAVELDPQNWEARTDLAEFYLEAPPLFGGGKEKASAQADALMALYPGMSHWIAARIAEKNKDNVTAERELRAAIAASHSGVRAWLDLASFLRHAGRQDEMEQALRNLESSPIDHPPSLLDGANMLLRTNRDLPLAVRLMRRYFSNGPVEEAPAFKAHDLLGQLLEKQGDRKSAVQEFRAALALSHSYTRAEEDLKRVSR
jgi:tetratricopeptide (TPR) repeat protein